MSPSSLIIVIVCLVGILSSASAISFLERSHARRLFFGNHKTSPPTTTTEEPSFGQSFSNWLSGFVSGDSQKDKPSSSFSKLALLKQFLSSSSSSDGKGSKLDKLFQILTHSAEDDKNQASSSSNKLDRILGFFNSHGSSSSSSSNNLQLAMKLLSLAQGTGGLSSLSGSDMKSLLKFVTG